MYIKNFKRNENYVKSKKLIIKKKFGAHTHLTQHMLTKCCNITTTVNNASTSQPTTLNNLKS